MKRNLSVLLTLLCLIGLAAGRAQTDPNLVTGIVPTETYDTAQGSVDIGTGNLNLQIPLVHLSGRKGHDLDVTLTYNSQNWTPIAGLAGGVTNGIGNNDDYDIDIGWRAAYLGGLGSTGWQLNVPMLSAYGITTFSNGSSGPPPYGQSYSQTSCYQNFSLVMGDGRQFSFPRAAMSCVQTTSTCGSASSSGGSGCIYKTLHATQQDDASDSDSGTDLVAHTGQDVVLDLSKQNQGVGIVRFPDGSRIEFPMPANSAWFATPSGKVSAQASALVDANGNTISISSYNTTTTFTDTNGRTVTYTQGAQGGDTLTYLDSNGNPEVTTVGYSSMQNAPPPSFTEPAAGSGGITLVNVGPLTSMLSSITFPNKLAYSFQYDSYGEIVKITYPSGGYTRYEYGAFPVAGYQWTTQNEGLADSRQVIEKDVCPAAASGAPTSGYVGPIATNTCSVPEQKTTYTRSTNIATFPTPVSVTDPLGNKTTYTFSSCNTTPYPQTGSEVVINSGFGLSGMETSRAIYQGGATLLETVSTTAFNGCLPMKRVTTLGSGLAKETDWTYDTTQHSYSVSFAGPGSTVISGGYIAESDNALTQTDYDFGSQSHGSALRTTTNTWLQTNPVNNQNYFQAPIYILNQLRSQTIQNANGSQASSITNEYDNYTQGIAASGAVQHGTGLYPASTSYTTRGNITGVTQWVGGGAPSLTTRNLTYDDAGNVLSKQDPAGNITKYSFADQWQNKACVAANGNAASNVTAITNALSQTDHLSYNSCSSTLASEQDVNSQTTSFAYDCMDRRISAQYPDGGLASIGYSDAPSGTCPAQVAALPIQITQSTKLSSTSTKSEVTTLDGLARVDETQDTSYPSSPITVLTTYDGNGNVASVTNPYLTTKDSSYGVTQYQYDALGRKILQIDQDANTESWCYNGVGNSAITTCPSQQSNRAAAGETQDFYDENAHHWQRIMNALGQLTGVMEPDPNSGGDNMETDYVYDAYSDLTDPAMK